MTVQASLERALSQIANHPVSLRVAGRTDAGVHASGQVASFTTLASRTSAQWLRGANALSELDVQIDWVEAVPMTFHPRFSATARRYVYLFYDQGGEHPMLRGQTWGCSALDADAMHRAAQALVGEHDFSSFRGSGCQSLTPMRRVNRCEVIRQGAFVIMDIEANAFVLHMVRNIARCLHDIGCGRAQQDITDLLAARDRTLLGATAPPQGLYLAQVSYPDYRLPPPGPIPLVRRY